MLDLGALRRRAVVCTGADAGTYRDVVVKKGDICTFSGHAREVRCVK